MDEYREHGQYYTSIIRLCMHCHEAIHKYYREIIEYFGETLCKVKKSFLDIIQDSFGSRISSKIRRFVKKIWNKCHKALSHQAIVVVFLCSTPFVRSLVSSFEDKNADIMNAFLLPKKTKSSLILC